MTRYRLILTLYMLAGTSCVSNIRRTSPLEQMQSMLQELKDETKTLRKAVHELASADNSTKNLVRLIDLNDAPEKRLLQKIAVAAPKIFNTNEDLMGTGILILKNAKGGYLLSALHVIGLSTSVKVRFFNLKESDNNYLYETATVPGVVVGWTTDKKDLVLIKIDTVPPGVEPIPLAPDDALNTNQIVWRFGFNDGYRWTHGLYLTSENKDPAVVRKRVLLSVERGASGGPIVNDKGELVGVLQNFYESDNEVVTEKDQRLYKHDLSTALFMPVNFIHEFLKKQLK